MIEVEFNSGSVVYWLGDISEKETIPYIGHPSILSVKMWIIRIHV